MVYLSFIEELCCRTTDFSLFTIPADQFPPHESIAHKPEDDEGYDEHECCPGKILHHKQYSGQNWDHENQKIRDNVFPGYLHPDESLRVTFLKNSELKRPLPKAQVLPK
jgi:hypothetical protein